MQRTTLEQWRMLHAVVHHGGFAQAAQAIHKSQSTINHAVHKLQDQLGVTILEVVGRKAQLTPAGSLLLRRAERLLAQAQELESVADALTSGVESELRVAVDEVFPYDYLADALQQLAHDFPNTRVELRETVLSGGPELLVAGEVDLLIAAAVPQGFLGDALMRTEFIAVAHRDHPLHQLPQPLQLADLATFRQVVVRDSALGQRVDSGWLGAEQRWTVSHVATSVDMVARGLCFAWLPEHRVAHLLASGELREIALEQGSRRYTELYLILANSDLAGPACTQLAATLVAHCSANTSKISN
jgi:DNA-binding transcriptional LysR family regulator